MRLCRVPGILALLGLATSLAAQPEVFRPFEQRAYRHVNSHHFSPDGRTLYLALFPARVAAEQGLEPPEEPEISIYVSSMTDDGSWSAPAPISFAGRYKDYEPTLSPDGTLMLFNSWRPMPDGSPITDGKNNLWLSRRDDAGRWTEPVILEGASKLETEESYPAISADSTVYYCQETLDADGQTVGFDIYVGRLEGDRLVDVRPFAPGATEAGEGDPWVSPDGSVLVFTRWEEGGDWAATVDLYVSFRREDGWSEAVPAPHNDADGPDYSPAASADGQTFYWRQTDGVIRMIPMRDLLTEVAAGG